MVRPTDLVARGSVPSGALHEIANDTRYDWPIGISRSKGPGLTAAATPMVVPTGRAPVGTETVARQVAERMATVTPVLPTVDVNGLPYVPAGPTSGSATEVVAALVEEPAVVVGALAAVVVVVAGAGGIPPSPPPGG